MCARACVLGVCVWCACVKGMSDVCVHIHVCLLVCGASVCAWGVMSVCVWCVCVSLRAVHLFAFWISRRDFSPMFPMSHFLFTSRDKLLPKDPNILQLKKKLTEVLDQKGRDQVVGRKASVAYKIGLKPKVMIVLNLGNPLIYTL